ncbi:MAG: 5'-deoxynucleotidase [Thermobacillus sp. ZCTH02-B1]|uniref:5'-deoxynucleotidase n=1 Tax=Thermobacillus sp. ZCTH02-B1 TaxID=1858795 RepID=UPI000B56E122|nr:5'-deoxynucleotidase [Thermobacillus sp. ZCTH02-B1]OUM93840.1 MAG: 5'-deoxynucleotidase [Thermobacillus sp. ZCTH02-B1]
MESHFLAYLYRLRHIERWSLMRNTTRENVAEHSFHVALLTHILCEIGNRVFGRRLNADRAAAMALFHDATEVFTGDIPTPVKHHNPRMLDSFREIEALAAERLAAMVPEPLREAYAPLLKGKTWQRVGAGEGGNAEQAAEDPDAGLRIYLKAADLLDAYLKCTIELASGNREFAVARRQIKASLDQLALPEAEWFLKHFAPSFSKTLDELSENM